MYSTAIQNNQFSSNIDEITHLLRTEFQGHNRGGMLANEHNKDMGILLKANVHFHHTKVKVCSHFLTKPLLQGRFDTKGLSVLSYRENLT